MRTVFGLVDCNNFFASCERVFAPHLEGRPVLVLSNNDGCIIARSNEVKALGIPMGAPFHEYKWAVKEHGIHVFSANFVLYGDLSHRVMDILAKFSNELEPYSIDEAFIDLAAVSEHNRSAYATTIRNTIKQHTGIAVSIGVASTKTLAKIASEIAKKRQDGVLNLSDSNSVDECLYNLPISDIWGIGRRLTVFLRDRGIYTALQLKNMPDSWIREHLHLPGVRLVRELHGISCYPFNSAVPLQKTIMSSRSFGRPVTTLEELKQAIASYTSIAAEKMRRQQMATRSVKVYIRTNKYNLDKEQYSKSYQKDLQVPTSYTPDLIAYAHEALEHIFDSEYQYHKAGVILSDFVLGTAVQGNLFEGYRDPQKSFDIMRTLDHINSKFGSDTVKLASTGVSVGWRMRQGSRSPRYTTRWDELPIVYAT